MKFLPYKDEIEIDIDGINLNNEKSVIINNSNAINNQNNSGKKSNSGTKKIVQREKDRHSFRYLIIAKFTIVNRKNQIQLVEMLSNRLITTISILAS
jgi:hypothetical protein